MKITAFNPLLITSHAAEIVALFEELGFEQAHSKTGIPGDIASYDLKYDDKFRVNVAQSDVMPQDLTAIRISVRDFDEAYNMLAARGFKGTEGSEGRDTGTSRSAMMISPTGFSITIVKHIKK